MLVKNAIASWGWNFAWIAVVCSAVGCASSPRAAVEPSWIDSYVVGSKALAAGDLATAKPLLEDAAQRAPQHVGTAYALACVAAREGRRDDVLRWFDRAIDLGFQDAALAEWDPDLAAVRDDKEFAARLTRLRGSSSSTTVGEFDCEVVTPSLYGEEVQHDDEAGVIVLPVAAKTALIAIDSGATIAVLERPGEISLARAVDTRHHRIAISASDDHLPNGPPESHLRVHDLRTGALLVEAPAPVFGSSLQFSEDGERLLIHQPFARNTEIVIAEPVRLDAVRVLAAGTSPPRISPDGRFVAYSEKDDATLVVAEVATGRVLTRIEDVFTNDNVSPFCFLEDSRTLVILDRTRRRLLSFALDREALSKMIAIEAAPHSRILRLTHDRVVVHGAGVAKVFAGAGLEVERSVDLPIGYEGISCERRNGTWVLDGGYERRPLVFDPTTDRELFTMGRVDDDAIPLDGGDYSFGANGADMLWSTRDGAVEWIDGSTLETKRRYGLSLFDAACAMDVGRPWSWFGSSRGEVEAFDWSTGTTMHRLAISESAIRALAIDRSGRWLVAVDAAGAMVRIDTRSLEWEAIAQEAGPFDASLGFPGPDSRLLVGRNNGSQVWVDVASDRVLGTLAKRTELAFPVAWSSDGRWLATVEQGEVTSRVSVRDPFTDRVLSQIDVETRIDCLSFRPDGSELWIGTQKSIVEIARVESDGVLSRSRSLDVSDLDALDFVEIGSIRFTRSGDVAVIASSGFGVVAAYETETLRRRWNFEYGGGNPAALQTVIDEANDRVLVFGQGEWSPRVVSLTDGTTLLDLAHRKISTLAPIVGSRRVLAFTTAGVEVLDVDSGRPLGTRIAVRSGGSVLLAPSGHCAGNAAALEQIHLVLPTSASRSLLALAPQLLDEKAVLAQWAGVEVRPAWVR